MTQDRTQDRLRLEPEMRVDQQDGPSPAARAKPMGTGPTIDQQAGRIPPLPRANRASGGEGANFHKRVSEPDIRGALSTSLRRLWANILGVLLFSGVTNLLVLAIPLYLFQISDRVLTSRSIDTLVMLTVVIVGAVLLQVIFDAIRRGMLLRSSVDLSARLGAPVLAAAARASLQSNGQEYQTLGDLQQVRSFLVSGTLLSFLDLPFAPLFILAIFLVHPHLGLIVLTTAGLLLVIALINQRATAASFAEANRHLSRANLHLDSMSRNSQIINALAMIPEAVTIWGRDAAGSMAAQVKAQDRNIMFAGASRAVRLLTQVGLLGWGAYLALQGEITGGMVIAASIIAGRALAPIEGAIEGWNSVLLSRAAYGRISALLKASPLNQQRLQLPHPEGRLDVERLLYVPGGTKRVVLNSITFSLRPGFSLAIVGKSGAGKTTLGKMLVGSILPTSGSVRLDLMDLRNWDQRQLGQCIGYLPQDVQLFPGTIKDNIARMRPDAKDEDIYQAAVLADVHDMIAQLPEGYETVVASDGSPLSGGQKQRIGLARAFFGGPRLVVLDEPNSNLDTAGDQALSRAMALAKKDGMTVIVVTQKYSLLQDVDNIMLLADGQIAAFGSRDQMLERLANSKQGGGNAAPVPAPTQPSSIPAAE